MVNSTILPKDLTESFHVTSILFYSRGLIYDEYRHDPVFPAISKTTVADFNETDNWNTTGYINRIPKPGIVVCIDNTYRCDPDSAKCSNYPANPSSTMTSDHAEGTEAEFAMILLTNALRGANLCEIVPASPARLKMEPIFEMESMCFNSRVCHDIPQDQ